MLNHHLYHKKLVITFICVLNFTLKKFIFMYYTYIYYTVYRVKPFDINLRGTLYIFIIYKYIFKSFSEKTHVFFEDYKDFTRASNIYFFLFSSRNNFVYFLFSLLFKRLIN